MYSSLEKLQPQRLWHHFLEICKIPRPSRNEGKIARHIIDFARNNNLDWQQDDVGNVLVCKPATRGYEGHPGIILQSHLDMVCEKNADTVHDFMTDPITPWIDVDWVRARGTTLGADDGIGIAAQMAILEAHDITHGPLEALFTIDEETGLAGAFGLKPGFLKGRILLNLDSEDEGQIFIGCAGGKDTVATMDLQTETTPAGMASYRISVTGLKGGHSGDDIHKGLGNAVKLINRILWNGTRELGLRLADIDAGNLRNAIAREGFATVLVPAASAAALQAMISDFHSAFTRELHVTEPELTVSVVEVSVPDQIFTRELQQKVMNVLYSMPHGVIAMSREIPNFVETSTNLASVKAKEGKVVITTSQRSSVESSKKDVADMAASVFSLAGASVEQSAGYPGWNPNPASAVLKASVDAYRKLFSEEPQVLAIHAGLECGLIGAIYPGMDMISFGPTIKGAHSPDERLHIPSVMKFWKLTLDIMKNLK